MTKLEFLHKVTARLKYNRLWAEFLYHTGYNIKNKNWIFIAGCYNSGTTLLDQILASHPQISGLPDEGVMLTDQLVRPEDFNWRRMWCECEKEMENSKRNKKKNAKRIKRHWSHFYDSDSKFLLEKSISNITRLKFFSENFQPAYFIHIVRNGYAVAEGIKRKADVMQENTFSTQKEYPIELCAKQWVRSLEIFEENKKYLNKYIEIKYEDLSERPSETINKILDWLNLEKFPNDHFSTKFEVHEKKSTIKNMNHLSFERLIKEDIIKINQVAANYLKKYDYPILGQ